MLTFTARLLSTGFAAWRAGRVGPLEPARSSHRAWPGDWDPNLHLNEGGYLAIAGLSRVALWIRVGLLPRVLRDGWRPAVASACVTYHRSLAPFARFEVESRLVTWDEKYTYFEHRFLESEELVARVLVRNVFRVPGSGPVPPGQVLAAAGAPTDLKQPQLTEELEHWTRMRDAARAGR